MKISNILLLICLTSTLISCGGAEERKSAYLEKAKESLKVGDFDKARIELKNVLQIDPKHAEATFQLGRIYEGQKKFRKAFRTYTKATELDPENNEYQARLGAFHLLLARDFEKSTEIMNLILSKDKNDINGLMLKANILLKQEKAEDAKEIAKTLYEAHPDNIVNALFLSRLYANEKKYLDAINVLDKSITFNPNNQILLTELADMLFFNKDYVRSEVILREILDAHPEVFKNHLMLASFYQKTDAPEKSEEVLRSAISADEGNMQRKLVLVEFIQQVKGNDDAIKELEALIDINPKESALPLALARLQIATNNIDGAIATYKTAIKNFSDEEGGLTSRVQLAIIYMQKKDVQPAISIIDEAAEIAPNDPEVNFVKAKIALYNKNIDQAIISLRTVVKDNPDNIEAYIFLAESHKRNNEKNQADDVITRAYENNRDNIKSLLVLAKYHLQNKKIIEAEKIIDDYLALDSNNYEALAIKSNILNSAKNFAEAYEFADKIVRLYPDKENGYIQSVPALLSNKKVDEAIDTLNTGYKKTSSIKVLELKTQLQIVANKSAEAIADLIVASNNNKGEPVQLLLAKSYMANKDIVSAKKILLDSINMDKMRTLSYISLANIYYSDNNAQRATSVLQDGVNANSGDMMLGMQLASLYEKTGDIDNAIQQYESMLANKADNLLATNNLASLLSEHRQDDEGLNRAKELAEKIKDVDNPVILDTVGWVYYKTGNYTDAIATLKSVVEKSPDTPIFNYHLGMAYHKINDDESAREFLSKALESDTKFNGRSDAEKLFKML